MFFGELAIGEAVGCRLAHSLATDEGRIRKGTLLDAGHVAALAGAGHMRVVVARLDPDDDHEDLAATRVAEALSDGGSPASAADLRRSRASTGRVNLFAAHDGLLVLERELVLAANRVDEGITVATLGENARVVAGRLVATVKVIPFAVPTRQVDTVVALLDETRREGRAPLALAPFRALTAALVHTTLPTLRDSVIEKTSRITRERLAARGLTLVHESRCEHAVMALADALAAALRAGADLLLIVGASAISDRRDVVPAAVALAGGTVQRFGLPVDPGNLLLLARLDGRSVLGLPGCARSPRDNGLDRVLDRLACGVPLSVDWLDSLAVGGLLDEMIERPSPRIAPEALDRVGAVVLAAGASRRAGSLNKLLYPVAGEPMVRRVIRQIGASGVDDIVVVTGHEADAVATALDGLDTRLVHNPGHASGMAGSLVRGLSTLLDRDAVLVCLADMPDVSAALIDRLLDARRALAPRARARAIVVPVSHGRRGNPVLIGRAFFDLLLGLEGDVGARRLIGEHPDAVHEVTVDDDAILSDHDTPEELHTLDGR